MPVAERVPLLRAGANELAGKQDSARPDHGPGVMAFAALPELLVHRLAALVTVGRLRTSRGQPANRHNSSIPSPGDVVQLACL